jgi:hypothetical protein
MGLASQEYRAPRDLTNGKVIEGSAEANTGSGSAEARARALFGIAPPIPSRPKAPLVWNKFPSMRQTLILNAEDLIDLFEATPETKVGEREVFAETDFPVPAQLLQHRIERLKKLVAASKSIIDGLLVRVMKVRRDDDNILDKATREKFKREENARTDRCNEKLFRYRAALRSGNYREQIWRHQIQSVYFRDLVDDAMTFQDFSEAYYVDGEEKRFGGLVTHRTTDMVRDVTESRIFDVSCYEIVMQLDDAALRMLGESEDDQKRSWAYWQRWENAVIKAAVQYGVLRPRSDLLELLALTPYAQAAIAASDVVETDERENALALKTGGACYGGGIKGGGYRFRDGNFRRRSLESFDKRGPRKDGALGGGLEDVGMTSLRDIHDDAESYQPN